MRLPRNFSRRVVREIYTCPAGKTLTTTGHISTVNEAARDVARALAKAEAFAQSRRDRKKVEMLFAHLKRILRLGRLRLRGPSGAQFEFTLAAIAQNLRRLAKLVAQPPPNVPTACVA
jgi:phage head maturation protease